MSSEDEKSTAIEQREESNFLARQLLAVGKQLRIMGVIGLVTAVGIGVQDHFLLRDTNRVGLISAGRIEALEKSVGAAPKAGSRWSYGMMLDWVKQLANVNPGVVAPSAKEIHESHTQDL